MPVSLIVLDVEGVITRAGGSQQAWSLVDMLDVRTALADLGIPCVLCTGRQVPYGEAVIQALDLYFAMPRSVAERVREVSGQALLGWPSIAENGCYLYDPVTKCPAKHPALTEQRTHELLRLRAETLAPLVASSGAQFEAGKDFCVSVNPPLVVGGGGQRQSAAEYRRLVEASAGPLLASVEVANSMSAVDLTPKGISKAAGVQLLMEWTGTPPAEVLGVGDSTADQGWLDLVGYRAAPSNGREHLLGLHYCSPLPEARGLIDILSRVGSRELGPCS